MTTVLLVPYKIFFQIHIFFIVYLILISAFILLTGPLISIMYKHQICALCKCRYFSLVASPPRMCLSLLLSSSISLACLASSELIVGRRSATSLCMVNTFCNGLIRIIRILLFCFHQHCFIQAQVADKTQVNIHISILVHFDFINKTF